jgi:hypothetical protein
MLLSLHTCVNEVRRVADHGSINSQSLMASTGWARLLLDAAGKQLNHYISRAGHFLVAGILDYRRNLDRFYGVAQSKNGQFSVSMNTKNCV